MHELHGCIKGGIMVRSLKLSVRSFVSRQRSFLIAAGCGATVERQGTGRKGRVADAVQRRQRVGRIPAPLPERQLHQRPLLDVRRLSDTTVAAHYKNPRRGPRLALDPAGAALRAGRSSTVQVQLKSPDISGYDFLERYNVTLMHFTGGGDIPASTRKRCIAGRPDRDRRDDPHQPGRPVGGT